MVHAGGLRNIERQHIGRQSFQPPSLVERPSFFQSPFQQASFVEHAAPFFFQQQDLIEQHVVQQHIDIWLQWMPVRRGEPHDDYGR